MSLAQNPRFGAETLGTTPAANPFKGLHRHTREIIEWAREALDEFAPQSLRHLYYAQSAVLGHSYDTMKNPLKVARLRGIIDYGEIIDTTRDPSGPQMYSGRADFAPMAVNLYRHDIWSTQPQYVEVWTEAKTTVPIIKTHTWDLGVMLQACGGDIGLYTTYMAAQRFIPHINAGRDIRIVYVGDWNPKGEQIPKTIARNLYDRHGVDVEFIRVAITPKQIDEYKLPSRDVNMDDPQAIPWIELHGEDARHVELEALPPRTLIEIVRAAMMTELDLAAMRRKLTAQKRIRQDIKRRLS